MLYTFEVRTYLIRLNHKTRVAVSKKNSTFFQKTLAFFEIIVYNSTCV